MYGYIQQTLDTNTTAETLAVVWMFFCFKAMVNDYHSLPWKTCAARKPKRIEMKVAISDDVNMTSHTDRVT